jgi:hypothetical protein
MERIFSWWNAYQAWASSLDGEARLYILGGCVLLLMIYMMIDIIGVEMAEARPKAAKSIANKKAPGNKTANSVNREQSGQ